MMAETDNNTDHGLRGKGRSRASDHEVQLVLPAINDHQNLANALVTRLTSKALLKPLNAIKVRLVSIKELSRKSKFSSM